jgi:hypothetical protein
MEATRTSLALQRCQRTSFRKTQKRNARSVVVGFNIVDNEEVLCGILEHLCFGALVRLEEKPSLAGEEKRRTRTNGSFYLVPSGSGPFPTRPLQATVTST